MDDQQLKEIEARAAHITEYGGATADEERSAGEDVPALLAEVKRLNAELAAEREQVRVIRLVGEDEKARAAYEARDAERRGWQSRRAVENVHLADLMRDLDQARDIAAALEAENARIAELANQLDQDAAADEQSKDDVIEELINTRGSWSNQHPEVARLGALADVQRDIATEIRRILAGGEG